jgi:membrane protein DedA with SNARE-associated domain
MTAVPALLAVPAADRDGGEQRVFDWITQTVSQGGYPGIILMMLAENIFPPIPSELIMPLAGFVAAKGALHLGLVVLAGVLGSMLGALPWYYAGRLVGEARMRTFADRHGRWLTLDEKEIGTRSTGLRSTVGSRCCSHASCRPCAP